MNQPEPPPLLLVCLPHAGGSASTFNPWRRKLRPDIELLALELPGRGTRRDERPLFRMPELVAELTDQLLPRVDRPWALLGHSMGAMVAFELARRMPGRPPAHLFVSGRRCPASRSPLLAGLHEASDSDLVHRISALGGIPAELARHPSLIRICLPAMRADLHLSETYRPAGGPALRCPITALVGDADPLVSVPQAGQWRNFTRSRFTLRVFEGGHFFLAEQADEVIAAIREQVAATPLVLEEAERVTIGVE